MAEESGVPVVPARSQTEEMAQAPSQGRNKDEIALELMKFIAVSTGYGKGGASGAGFSGKPVTKSAEEQAEALLELFARCRRVVSEDIKTDSAK